MLANIIMWFKYLCSDVCHCATSLFGPLQMIMYYLFPPTPLSGISLGFFSSVLLSNVLFWPVSLLDICTLFPPVLFCYISAGCVQAEHIRWRGDVLPVGRSRGQGRVGTCHRSHHSLNILHHTGQALGSVDSTWPASSALLIRHPTLPPPPPKKKKKSHLGIIICSISSTTQVRL